MDTPRFDNRNGNIVTVHCHDAIVVKCAKLLHIAGSQPATRRAENEVSAVIARVQGQVVIVSRENRVCSVPKHFLDPTPTGFFMQPCGFVQQHKGVPHIRVLS